MSALTFTGKQELLRASINALTGELSMLFPSGQIIHWRMQNGMLESGRVVRQEIMGGYPVLRCTTDVAGFYSIVTIADILRAQL